MPRSGGSVLHGVNPIKKKSSEVISMKHNDQISAMNQEFKRASLFNISKHHFIPAIQI